MTSVDTGHRGSDSRLHSFGPTHPQVWHGAPEQVAFDEQDIRAKLLNLNQPCFILRIEGRIGVANQGYLSDAEVRTKGSVEVLSALPPLVPRQLGDAQFMASHGVVYPYAAGAMANGIASEELVITLGKAKILSSFGAGGLSPNRIATAIHRIQQALPQGPYAFNLLHSPSDPALERGGVDLYLKHDVRTLEASAFLDLTPALVYYRAAGLSLEGGQPKVKNKVLAKISRREVATKFLQPAPPKILGQLLEQGLITELQANLAQRLPVADDITVEADSGGHTDNRPLVCLLPSILGLRDDMQAKYRYECPIRVGAAGGIGSPQSALAAFMMGAAYVVTGSINQSCLEAGASLHTKRLLAQAQMPDVMMAPASDMFELGVRVQVLKRGTFFPLRAQRLFDLYKNYDAIEALPHTEREQLEKQIFRRSLESVWEETVAFFTQRDPSQLTRAANNPKLKMALIFRWYLGLSSRWSNTGEQGREADYQIWCGPAMGAFNDWVQGTYLAQPEARRVVEVAHHLMTGAAYLYRIQHLRLQGILMPPSFCQYRPVPMETI
ncbi:PfaD family polyunsaturated fatty acid/polyketide biosynthesis protein [Anthocerotibacter panamensis]|uniref:PfaD family polyunsaturated fatty acid/polyketide biosynthesis protein n=1 Tax=Anthocerotibacter panamensis TaxID=2857077 RepID=UPI001C405A5A|nr:PfaD family polyunsaturated fatty acid/polyketide biosynthesis protein [Anthocerotibacter panamensis]